MSDPDGNFGNPASRSHRFGWHAEEAVDIARNQIADRWVPTRVRLFSPPVRPNPTTGDQRCSQLLSEKGKHIITSKTEHKAVLDTCRQLEREGYEVTYRRRRATVSST